MFITNCPKKRLELGLKPFNQGLELKLKLDGLGLGLELELDKI